MDSYYYAQTIFRTSYLPLNYSLIPDIWVPHFMLFNIKILMNQIVPILHLAISMFY